MTLQLSGQRRAGFDYDGERSCSLIAEDTKCKEFRCPATVNQNSRELASGCGESRVTAVIGPDVGFLYSSLLLPESAAWTSLGAITRISPRDLPKILV
jgi:hypothetical protein